MLYSGVLVRDWPTFLLKGWENHGRNTDAPKIENKQCAIIFGASVLESAKLEHFV